MSVGEGKERERERVSEAQKATIRADSGAWGNQTTDTMTNVFSCLLLASAASVGSWNC